MGIWGTSLYAGDFARDLRLTVSAVLRLPFASEKLVEILRSTAASASDNPADEEYTTFWLVVADQFAKRGVASDRVRTTALSIIDRADDLATQETLGMKPADLRRRGQMLEELRRRIVATPTAGPRAVLRKPQPLLMEIGDVLVYPTCAGENINPYAASKEQTPYFTRQGRVSWSQDGWAAMVIVDSGRAFEFLSWYTPITVAQATDVRPSLESLRGELLWRLRRAGTCSANHFKRMELEKIGVVPVDAEKVRAVFPEIRPGISAAVGDISIANAMRVAAAAPGRGTGRKDVARTIARIDDIAGLR